MRMLRRLSPKVWASAVLGLIFAIMVVPIWSQATVMAQDHNLAFQRGQWEKAQAFTPHEGVIVAISQPYYRTWETVVQNVTVQSPGQPEITSPVPVDVNAPLVVGQSTGYWTYVGTHGLGDNPLGYELVLTGPGQHPWDAYEPQFTRALRWDDVVNYWPVALVLTWPGWVVWAAVIGWCVAWWLIRRRDKRDERRSRVVPMRRAA